MTLSSSRLIVFCRFDGEVCICRYKVSDCNSCKEYVHPPPNSKKLVLTRAKASDRKRIISKTSTAAYPSFSKGKFSCLQILFLELLHHHLSPITSLWHFVQCECAAFVQIQGVFPSPSQCAYGVCDKSVEWRSWNFYSKMRRLALCMKKQAAVIAKTPELRESFFLKERYRRPIKTCLFSDGDGRCHYCTVCTKR